MANPRIEVVPRKPAVCSDQGVTLDVLVRVVPPDPDPVSHATRPHLNLALVLDRSGSMEGAGKMPFARDAAVFVVEQLLPTDRVSVTVFDNVVETVVPSTLATDKPSIIRKVRGVMPRGSTDLHGGWVSGAGQAREFLRRDGVNRVMLLSDGLANQGVTDPNAITAAVRDAAAAGVSTTTLGVGRDYNEDLMEGMARAGDGHYYFVESPVQLPDIFQSELHGLMATHGQKVSLGVEPAEGVTVADVLNDFDRVSTGRHALPNLVAGMPVSVVVRLTVPPGAGANGSVLCKFRLAWNDPDGGPRRSLHAGLEGLGSVDRAAWDALPDDPAVVEQEVLLMAARAQREAARAMDRGDIPGSMDILARAYGATANLGTTSATAESDVIAQIQRMLAAGDVVSSSKLSKFRRYLRTTGRSGEPKGED